MLALESAKQLFRNKLTAYQNHYLTYKRQPLSFKKLFDFFDGRIPGESDYKRAERFLTQVEMAQSVRELIQLTQNRQFNDPSWNMWGPLRNCVLEIMEWANDYIAKNAESLERGIVDPMEELTGESSGTKQDKVYCAIAKHFETCEVDRCTVEDVNEILFDSVIRSAIRLITTR